MPTYQYACTACGEQIEVMQKFSDAPVTECPTCEGRLRKVFSPVGIVFKGSGFYRTDSRAANGSTAGGKDNKDNKGKQPSETGASSSDSKGEAKSDGATGSTSSGGKDSSSSTGNSSSSGSSGGTSPGSSSSGTKVA